MKLSIPRSALKEAVTGFSKIVPNKTSLPILGCLIIEADGRKVTAYATDLDQHAAYTFNDTVCDAPGTFTIGLQSLKDLVKGPDSDKLEFTAGNDNVTVINLIAGQPVRLELPAIDPAEWPMQAFSVRTQPVDGFLETFQRLAPFASTDSTRHVINSCYLDVSDKGEGKSCMVATDGRRLTLCNSMSLPLKDSVIVPTSKFLSWLNGTCQIGIAKHGESRWFAVESGPWTYSVKQIDATYPNFRQVVPTDPGNNKIVFAGVISSLRHILKALPNEDKQGTIVLRQGNTDKLAVCAKGADGKDVSVELPGCTFTGKVKQYALNRNYLLDAIDAGFTTFNFTDELSPALSDDGKGGKHVVMPMRVDSTVRTIASVTPAAKTEASTATPSEAVKPATTIETTSVKQHEKGTRKMNKPEATAIERLQAAYEAAKDKLREAHGSLQDLTAIIRDAVKEDKVRRGEVDDVRKSLAKIQSIKV